MAWIPNVNANLNDEGRISDYNSASYKMFRLHELFKEINSINNDLSAFNLEFNIFNYELKFRLLESLYQEVESKLRSEEKYEGEGLRVCIQELLKKYPVHTEIRNNIYPYKTIKKVNHVNLNIIRNWLFKFESLVRQLIDSHGMDTRYDDESSLF